MSKLLIEESPLTFQPSLAVKIGLNEAIVLQQVHYWISNPKNKGYEQDGYKWVYNTYAEWKETNFPFWSENTIQRTFSNLEEAGLIISIQPMKAKYDRTKYYRIEYTKLEVFDDPKLVCSLSESESTTEKTIPLSIENAIVAGIPVTEGMLLAEKVKDIAPKMFEKALGFSKPLPWWSNKEWSDFSAWVVERYTESQTAFGEYNIWRATPYTKGGMANTRIRGFPHEFYDSWDMFRMSINQIQPTRPEHKPIEEITNAIPNPYRKPKFGS